ncbi:MAG TPA: hypothetical protein VGJ32_15460, partial [Solirubrobacteraceae bacterium]
MSPAATGPLPSMRSHRLSRKPITLLALVLGLLLCGAPATARAATLESEPDGTLVYTADFGKVNVVSFTEVQNEDCAGNASPGDTF